MENLISNVAVSFYSVDDNSVCPLLFIDAQKYNLLYTPDMYSRFSTDELKKYDEHDVVFIGAAKDRLLKIIEIYDKLNSFGLDCWFYIVGAKSNEQIERNGIIYSNDYLPFKEVIGRQIAAKCLMEITQQGCTDATLRFWDAVMYNKKIITNCQAVRYYSYFNEKNILLFDNIDDIKKSFFENNDVVEFNYMGDISPVYIFNRMEKQLEGKGNEAG